MMFWPANTEADQDDQQNQQQGHDDLKHNYHDRMKINFLSA